MPTKPEGPAQEPAWICPHGISAQRIMPDGGFYNPCPRCAQLVTPQIRELERENNALTDELTKLYEQATEHVETIILARELLKSSAQPPATPAPSQPAGTREKNWLVEAVENCPDPVLRQNCKQLLGNDYTNAAVQFIADAQTAAKHAEIAELKRQLKSLEKTMRLEDETTAAERKGWTARAEAAERERDSLASDLQGANRMIRDYDERLKALKAENAALKAGKDGQQ